MSKKYTSSPPYEDEELTIKSLLKRIEKLEEKLEEKVEKNDQTISGNLRINGDLEVWGTTTTMCSSTRSLVYGNDYQYTQSVDSGEVIGLKPCLVINFKCSKVPRGIYKLVYKFQLHSSGASSSVKIIDKHSNSTFESHEWSIDNNNREHIYNDKIIQVYKDNYTPHFSMEINKISGNGAVWIQNASMEFFRVK
jgi:hypothetical protein